MLFLCYDGEKEVILMAKTKEYFEFRCRYQPDEVLECLRERVKHLRDREYLLKETDVGFDLGIGRGGHQGGYWYCAAVSPEGEGSFISGRVVYRTWHGKEIKMRWFDWAEMGCLIVLFLPLVLGVWIYRFFRPEITDEERFVEFMVTQMDCEWMT